MGNDEVKNPAQMQAAQKSAACKAQKATAYIALNPNRRGNKGQIQMLTLAAYDQLTQQPWLHQMVEAIRGGNEKLKRDLPYRSIHYSRFLGGRRRQDCIDPTSFLFQTCVDIDEKSLVDTAREMALLLNEQEHLSAKDAEGKPIPNPWYHKLLHMDYSARKKLHIDIRMPLGLTIEETQRAYCQALGVPCDESCFSPERIIFITDKESEIYRSADWYMPLPQEEILARREAYKKRGLSIDGRGKAKSGYVSSSDENKNSEEKKNSKEKKNSEEKKFPMTKSLIAFDLLRESVGLKDVPIDVQGSRHSSLLAILSAGASRIMTEEELRRVLLLKMPVYGTEPNCHQLVHDFYEKYADGSRPFTRELSRINAEAEKQCKLEKLGVGSEELGVNGAYGGYGVNGANGVNNPGSQQLLTPNSSLLTKDSSLLTESDAQPPRMPRKLPKLVKLLTSRTPDIYKPAVAHAIFPPLATHLWRVSFPYIDGVDHEATLMCALLAGTGAGKSCVNMPINYIMADIRERDKENLAKEKAWKDEVTRKGANKDKRKRPEGLIIQEIDADMTNPAFVMRTAEAQEHFLYTTLNELDQFDALKGQGNQHFRIMCLAFDPGNLYGQTRVGLQSITERVRIRFNWNASSTIHKGKRYFSRVLTDGPVSRINFCTIPEREIGADMPIYGSYGDDFAEQLQPYIDNLLRATGRIECPEAYELAQKLKEENADYARMTQSRTYENLSYRANVIAYLKACVLYVANGEKWEPEMEDFIRWSEQYDLWCKMRFFGESIEKSELEGEKTSKRGPRNLLQLLPDVFTLQEAIATRLANGLDQQGTRPMLNAWVHRGYIRRLEGHSPTGNAQGNASARGNDNNSNDSFEKLKFRRDGVRIETNS